MTTTHLRALYRQLGEPGFPQVRAEYERMGLDVPLDSILATAWTEGRENAGWRYDSQRQNWRRADGSVVVEDCGGMEWCFRSIPARNS
jgi:hypothetical protein